MVIETQEKVRRVSIVFEIAQSKTYVITKGKVSLLWEKNGIIKEEGWVRPLKSEKYPSSSKIKRIEATWIKIK